MLITVSGIVGSGKTTAARIITRTLADAGLEVESSRFQYLPCFRLPGLTPSAQRDRERRHEDRGGRPDVTRLPGGTGESRVPRGGRERGRRLGVRLAAGYLARILAFRWYLWRRGARRHLVFDRYFYDSLANYRLDTPVERALAALLLRAMPRPDLAVVLVASPALVRERRPDYTPEYVARITQGFRALTVRLPDLVPLSADAPEEASAALATLARRIAAASAGTDARLIAVPER